MKIMRFAGGLGNNMFQYAAYMQLKRMYPLENIYIDDTPLRIYELSNELEKIFNVKIPIFGDYLPVTYIDSLAQYEEQFKVWKKYGYKDILDLSRDEKYRQLVMNLSFAEIHEMYKEMGYIFKIVSDARLNISICELEQQLNESTRIKDKTVIAGEISAKFPMAYRYLRVVLNANVRRGFFENIRGLKKPDFCGFAPVSRLISEGDTYYNIYGNPNDCIGIREELLEAFHFKDFHDDKNVNISDMMKNCNSVAVHARISDYEYGMADLVKRKYFRKAVAYIKKKVKNPVFFLFSDDIIWWQEHLEVLSLKDNKVVFVGYNSGANSYIDMQLMSLCKHNIIPNSTFSWWGAYLNQNPNKIVITPYGTLPGTISF